MEWFFKFRVLLTPPSPLPSYIEILIRDIFCEYARVFKECQKLNFSTKRLIWIFQKLFEIFFFDRASTFWEKLLRKVLLFIRCNSDRNIWPFYRKLTPPPTLCCSTRGIRCLRIQRNPSERDLTYGPFSSPRWFSDHISTTSMYTCIGVDIRWWKKFTFFANNCAVFFEFEKAIRNTLIF